MITQHLFGPTITMALIVTWVAIFYDPMFLAFGIGYLLTMLGFVVWEANRR